MSIRFASFRCSKNFVCRAMAIVGALVACAEMAAAEEEKPPTIALITTIYYHNSHADVIASRLFQTDSLDGKGAKRKLQLASVYTDQVDNRDVSRKFAQQYGFPIHNNVRDALTLGGDKLAVDGVFLIAEHGNYPESDTGQIIYPKRRLFEQIVKVFEDSGRAVPVFSDKHLADNWQDAKFIYDTAQRLKIPMMAGSSLPGLWRYPPRDLRRDAKVQQIVAVSYHRLDTYGIHALEMVQSLAERRAGGETGVRAVQCLSGEAVWQAGERGVYDPKLLDACMARLQTPLRKGTPLKQSVPMPVLFHIEYLDGTKASILTLDGAVGEWSCAWRYADGGEDSTLFWTQEARPFQHFGFLLDGIESMMLTGQPAWPVERTLLTSGLLDALLISKKQGGQRLDTPQLQFKYQSDWNWKEPPPPPPGRPIPCP